jgi:hypothetical protein
MAIEKNWTTFLRRLALLQPEAKVFDIFGSIGYWTSDIFFTFGTYSHNPTWIK